MSIWWILVGCVGIAILFWLIAEEVDGNSDDKKDK